MEIFVWKRIENLTSRWHSEGGAVVIAETLERAKEILKTGESVEQIGPFPEPDEHYEVMANDEKVFIFPDSGCC